MHTAERLDDAWGSALLDYVHHRDVPELLLETDGGKTTPAMHPEWFFRTYAQWDWWERELLSLVTAGPVLDLGCGAGRTSLYFQERGFDVTAVDSSPGAVEVCRLRGVRDARLGDLNDPPADRRWAAILLLCGNLGLGGSWDGNRELLARLAQISTPGAVLVGDSVNSTDRAAIGLRIHYQGAVTPWWRQRNVSADEVPSLVEGTGWQVERALEDGVDHAVLLRKPP
jgi:SAM-dependent methyltransferase